MHLEYSFTIRVQVEFFSIKEGYKEFDQSVRMFLTEDFNAIKTSP